MSIEALKAALPDWAKDLRLNLSTVAGETTLKPQTRWGALLASAIAARNPAVIAAIEAEAAAEMTPDAMAAARTAAAIMAMNNVYYRFAHLVDGDYKSMPARLRMNAMANPGVDKSDFELWSLAVSAINGCGACIVSHERQLRTHGVPAEAIQAAARIAAVVHAVAVTLEAGKAAQHQAAE